MMALFSSIQLEISGGRTIEYMDHFHPNLLMYKLLFCTDDKYQSDFVIENCDMIYLKQNFFSADRQNVRENGNLFVFFEQTGRSISSIYYNHFNGSQHSYNDFNFICEKVCNGP